jgi:hypothetical protein
MDRGWSAAPSALRTNGRFPETRPGGRSGRRSPKSASGGFCSCATNAPSVTRSVRVASGKQRCVRFDRKDDSIPHDGIRRPRTLIASECEIRITDAVGHELARQPPQL